MQEVDFKTMTLGEKIDFEMGEEDGRKTGCKGFETYPLFWINMFLNYTCTRSCTNCFAGGGKNNFVMPDDVYNRLLNWLVEVYNLHGFKYSCFVYLGGEPLLEFDKIVGIMEHMEKNNVQGVYHHISSNFDLIDKIDLNRLVYPSLMSFNITDLSFDEVSKRSKYFGKMKNVVQQEVKLTAYESNLPRLKELAEFGISNGFRVRIYRDQTQHSNEEYKTKFIKALHEYLDVFEKYIEKGYHTNVKYVILDALIPNVPNRTCGRANLNVYPDGSVGPCIRALDDIKGTLWTPNPLKLALDEKYIYSSNSKYCHDDCRECKVKHTCKGGCPYDKSLAYGEIKEGMKSPWCRVYKEIVPRIDKIANKNRKGNSITIGI